MDQTGDRIAQVISHFCESNADFANKMEVSRQAVSNWMTRKVSKRVLDDILIKFPKVNPGWLYSGIGEMIKEEDPERVEKKIEITESLIKIGEYTGALVYDIDGTCGLANRNMEFTQENIIGSVNLPEINPHSPIIRANGDSMEPVIFDGDRIAIREIVNKEDIFYGQIYLVLTEEYRMIKYIRKCKEDENFVILKSRNPEYDDIRIQKDKIKKLFIVENILAIKTRV